MGLMSAFMRVVIASKGEATTNCHFPAVFPSPRASLGCPAVAHSGCPGYSGTIIYPSSPESLVSNRDPPNTDELLILLFHNNGTL